MVEAEIAYHYFQNNIGFDESIHINSMINDLKKRYDKVYLLGFSIGATIAWICSANANCDGVIGLYGSRIRDYTCIQPQCRTLLVFAEKDSFDVDGLISKLLGKQKLETMKLGTGHGYMDGYSSKYNAEASLLTEEKVDEFLTSSHS